MVQPLVVIWGATQQQIPDGCEVDGIPFVGGRRLQAWLERLDGAEVGERAAKEIISELEKFRARTSDAAAKRRG